MKIISILPCNCIAMQSPVMYHRVEFELPAYSLAVDDAVAVEFASVYSVDHHFHRVCGRSVPIIHDILHSVHYEEGECENWHNVHSLARGKGIEMIEIEHNRNSHTVASSFRIEID